MDFSDLDIIWILLASVLVFFMQAGFALAEAGFTRAKNTVNIMMKNIMDFSLGIIVYFLIGFGLMFGRDLAGLIGGSDFMLHLNGTDTSNFIFFFFQGVFCATAATIVSGAMAERTKFSSYLLYTVFLSALIYPITGHWIWGGGWLGELGFVDFAGSTVVHSVGGWAALAGVIMLGPRIGKYNKDGSSNAIPGHNLGFASLGVFILWLGWFGFNAGSTLSAASPAISFIVVNTALAAAASALSAMAYVWIKYKKPDVSMTLNGALAGLVGITAGCAVVSPSSAIFIGLLSGIIVCSSIELLEKRVRLDDPVGAISVHGVCGAFGTIAVGLFSQPGYADIAGYGRLSGLLFGGGFSLLGIQVAGVLSVFAWVFPVMLLFFFLVKKTMGLRVSREAELKGLDIEEHGMEAYSGFQIFLND
jgi:ammonium transporter, Amt family